MSSDRPDNISQSNKVSLTFDIFWSFLKIGSFTFGGGYAMVPLIEREVIERKHWVEKDKFLELLILAQSAPGPIALNTGVFVGYRLNGYVGAIAAVMGIVVPSFVIILLIAMFFADIRDNRLVEAMFKSMRPAVVALIISPVLGLSKGMGGYRIALAVVVAAAIWRLNVSPIVFILLGAAGGIAWIWWRGRRNGKGGEDPAGPDESLPGPETCAYPDCGTNDEDL